MNEWPMVRAVNARAWHVVNVEKASLAGAEVSKPAICGREIGSSDAPALLAVRYSTAKVCSDCAAILAGKRVKSAHAQQGDAA